jgi:hypothetical protein
MAFRGKRLGLERRFDEVEDAVEGLLAEPPAEGLFGDDGIGDGYLRLIVINGFAGNLVGPSLAASKIRVYFTDIARRIYGTPPAGAKYAILKFGGVPVYHTDPADAWVEVVGADAGQVELLDLQIVTASNVLLTKAITYIEVQNNLSLS